MRNGAIHIAVKAARAAGNVILRSMNRLESVSVTQKERHDFVSEVDRAAEFEILKEIQRNFPSHAILAEESGNIGSNRFTWVIDPLDGTSNYLRGFPHWCISIAQMDKGEPVLGVIYDPLRDELFSASKGDGAQLNGRKIRVGQKPGDLEGTVLATGFRFRQHTHAISYLDMTREILLQVEDIRRTGSSALDMAYVASGRLDGYFEIGLKPWDLAAGSLILRESGGISTDFQSNTEFLNQSEINIVAGNPKVLEALIPYIKKHMSQI